MAWEWSSRHRRPQRAEQEIEKDEGKEQDTATAIEIVVQVRILFYNSLSPQVMSDRFVT